MDCEGARSRWNKRRTATFQGETATINTRGNGEQVDTVMAGKRNQTWWAKPHEGGASRVWRKGHRVSKWSRKLSFHTLKGLSHTCSLWLLLTCVCWAVDLLQNTSGVWGFFFSQATFHILPLSQSFLWISIMSPGRESLHRLQMDLARFFSCSLSVSAPPLSSRGICWDTQSLILYLLKRLYWNLPRGQDY